MAEHEYIDLDELRGYRICEKRTFVDTDQGEQRIDSFVAIRPPPEQEVVHASTLEDLRRTVEAMSVSFAEIDGYVIEITHDLKNADTTNVNVFDLSGGHVRSGTFPKNGGKKELLDILPSDVAAKGPDAAPDVAQILQTLRTRPKVNQD